WVSALAKRVAESEAFELPALARALAADQVQLFGCCARVPRRRHRIRGTPHDDERDALVVRIDVPLAPAEAQLELVHVRGAPCPERDEQERQERGQNCE